jgi:hypothetical protein
MGTKMAFTAMAMITLLAACSKSESGSKSAVAAAVGAKDGNSAAFTHPVLGKWTQAGLTVSIFTADVSGKLGKECHSGTVSGISAILCKHPDDKSAVAAEPTALAWIGESTGSVLSSGSWQLVVVDRANADPSGRSINAITKVFR